MSLQLFMTAADDWTTFLGYCINSGIGDPRDLTTDQFCALVWFLMCREKEEHEIEMMKAQLWIPPAGVELDERSPWHPKNQLRNLQRVKQSTSKP